MTNEKETQIISRVTAAKIIVLRGKSDAPSYDLIGNEILLGRDETCDIQFKDPKISSTHAKLIKKDSSYVIQDLNSTNGTLVNHTRVADEILLTSGDQIHLGDVVLQFALFDEAFSLSSDATQSGIFLPSWEPETPSYRMKPKRFISKYKIGIASFTLLLLFFAYFISEQKLEQKPLATATSDFKEKITQIDNGLLDLTQMDQEYALAKFNAAKDLAKNRKYKEANLALQEALRIAPKFKPALDLQTILQQTLDIQLQEEEKFKAVAAEQKLEEEIKYHVGVAMDYFNRQQWDRAVEEYDKILELHPEHEEAQERRQLAQEKREVKQVPKEPSFAQVQKKRNKEAERLLAEGTRLSQKGKIREALSTWRAVFQMEGIDSQHYAKAEQFINFTKNQIDQKYEPLLIEVDQLMESKEYTKAKEILETILKEYPAHEKARSSMEKVLFALHGIAKRQYTEAIIDENMGRIEAARDKFLWIVERIPANDEYHQKSKNKLRKYE